MRMRWLALVVVGILGLAPRARASETGGSMGGGDFSDSSSSSGSTDSYTPSTPSYSYSDTSYDPDTSSPDHYHTSGSGGSGGTSSAELIFFAIGAAIWIVAMVVKQRGPSFSAYAPSPDFAAQPGPPRASGNSADVTVLRVAIDARARKLVQGQLARIAGAADTRTADGRAAMLREVALLLRRMRDSWVYGGAHNEPMMSMSGAQRCFQGHVDDARARFRTETIRNEQGAVTRADAPELHATSDDGPGVMLVTLVVAARHELFAVGRIGDGEELRKALESLSSMIGSELVAVEIVWMPSAEDERISSIALEHAYPRPDLIPITGALVGKVFCTFCGAPYPAEAIACPNCGGRPHAADPGA